MAGLLIEGAKIAEIARALEIGAGASNAESFGILAHLQDGIFSGLTLGQAAQQVWDRIRPDNSRSELPDNVIQRIRGQRVPDIAYGVGNPGRNIPSDTLSSIGRSPSIEPPRGRIPTEAGPHPEDPIEVQDYPPQEPLGLRQRFGRRPVYTRVPTNETVPEHLIDIPLERLPRPIRSGPSRFTNKEKIGIGAATAAAGTTIGIGTGLLGGGSSTGTTPISTPPIGIAIPVDNTNKIFPPNDSSNNSMLSPGISDSGVRGKYITPLKGAYSQISANPYTQAMLHRMLLSRV